MAKKIEKSFTLPQLDTRNVLNVVEDNFKALGLKAYAVRIIYAGEHTLSKEDITKHFKLSVKAVNASYCDIHIRGFLLVYDSYFIHILEGSEDTVYRQLRFLFKREEDWIKEKEAEEEELQEVTTPPPAADEPSAKNEWKMFRRLKMLMVYHSVKTLKFESWRAVTARPPSLVGKLNIHGPLSEHVEQLRVCLDKIAKLCAFATSDEDLCFDGLAVTDPKIESLPEVTLLDFLLQSPYVMDLRHVVHLHRRVDDYYYYFEHVWPLPNHFTPRNLYKLKIDDSFVEPLPVMPWERAKREEKENDMEERQSVSSIDD